LLYEINWNFVNVVFLDLQRLRRSKEISNGRYLLRTSFIFATYMCEFI